MTIEQDGFVFEFYNDDTVTVKYYRGGESILQIPWEIDGCPVTVIGDWAFGKFFGKNRLTHISIPETVTVIGAFAFNRCEIASLPLPGGLKRMGVSAFSGCAALEALTIPEGVTVLEERVFNGCRSLARIQLHDGITAISKGAFEGCRALTGITLPPLITRIEYETFRDCRKLAAINIHENITYIGNYAFANCLSLSRIALPDSVAYIGRKDAFPADTVIHGSYNSYAEQYAKKFHFAFKPVYPDNVYQEPKTNREVMLTALEKIKAYDETAIKNPRVFKGLVSDYLPGGGLYAGFRNILYAAVNELRICEALEQAKTDRDYIASSRLVYSLVELGYQESLAGDAVACFEAVV
jgi:hypothetical protein